MKKALIFVLCTLLFSSVLAGCGSNPSVESSAAASDITATQEVVETGSVEPTKTVIPDPFELDTKERIGRYSYKVPSLLRASRTSDANTYYITGNDDDGRFKVYYQEFLTEMSDDATAKESLEYAVSQIESFNDTSNLTTEYGLTIAGNPAVEMQFDVTMDGIENKGAGVLVLDKNGVTCFFASEPETGEGRLLATFPSIVENISEFEPEDDFVKSEDAIIQIRGLLYDFKFDEIIAMADAYIAEKSPVQSDSVFAIKQAAEEANAVMPNCTLVSDEFEGRSVLYGGVEEIGWDVNFVPYIDEPRRDSVPVYVGFKQDEWLFFDKLKIKVADDSYIRGSFDYIDVQRDVMSGGAILEKANDKLDYDEVERILNSENPVMRFTGEYDKTRDHKMTDSELESLQNVYVVLKSIDAIKDTIDQWQEENLV